MQMTFVKIAMRHFQFLESEFGFSLASAKESPRGEAWEGILQYATKTTNVELSCTRGEHPTLRLGRTRDEKKYLLPLQVIYEYLTLSNEEKRVVLSILEAKQANTILRNKQLADLMPKPDSVKDRFELQLNNYAQYLREYGKPLLKGDFSQWPAIWEYHIMKLSVENVRAGRPEFVPIVIADEHGKNRVVGKQSIFQQSLDYVHKLREEIQAG